MQDNSDSFDPEFLTFRHNAPQVLLSSGRSIYSQRFDYKSLQKCPIFDTCSSGREDPNARTTKKTKYNIKDKNIRTVKSQDKYKQVIFGDASNYTHNNNYNEEDYEQQHIVCTESQELQPKIIAISNNGKKNSSKAEDRLSRQHNLQKNIELKAKLSKLVKSMKKQQKRQYTLADEIHQLQAELQNHDKQLQQQNNSISELRQISQQNIKQCNRIIDQINRTSTRSQSIAAQLQNLQHSYDSAEHDRPDDSKDRTLFTQLKQGLSQLTKMKNTAESKLTRLEQQIQALEHHLEVLKSQEGEIGRILGYAEPASHRSWVHSNSLNSQNFSGNSNSHQSGNYSNSSGSNREILGYY